jgi:phenylalanine-4-hydroxylase
MDDSDNKNSINGTSKPLMKSPSQFGLYLEDDLSKSISIVLFSMKEQVGALTAALKIFSDNGVNLNHIESRSSKRFPNDYEFIVELDTSSGKLDKALEELRDKSQYMTIISRDKDRSDAKSVPWFPGKRKDLDQFANQILSYGSELDSDHPGFTDPIYRARRKQFADIAFNYKQ